MRIAFDLTAWSSRRGYGRFTRGLVRAALAAPRNHELVLLTDEAGVAGSLPPGGRHVVVDSAAPASHGLRAGRRRSLGSLRRLGRAVADARPDWLVFPSVYSYFPAPRGCRVVVGIHDTIPEDLPRLVFPHWRERARWRLKSWAARRRADALMTVSAHARDALVRRFGVAAGAIWVVEEAPDPLFRPLAPQELDAALATRLGLDGPEPIIGYVGGFNPHKNLVALVDAVAALRHRPLLGRLRLLLAGDLDDPFTPGRQAVIDRADRLGLADAVRFTGHLTDAELVQMLNRISVLALPSLAEGFGLPAVEAAACGTPVVATRESPLPQLLAGGGRFVDPRRPDELERALAEILEDEPLRTELGHAARRQASRLSWERAAAAFFARLEAHAPAGGRA